MRKKLIIYFQIFDSGLLCYFLFLSWEETSLFLTFSIYSDQEVPALFCDDNHFCLLLLLLHIFKHRMHI